MLHVLVNGNNFNAKILDEALEDLGSEIGLIFISKGRFGIARVIELYAAKKKLPFSCYPRLESVNMIDVVITFITGNITKEMRKVMDYVDDSHVRHIIIDRRPPPTEFISDDDHHRESDACASSDYSDNDQYDESTDYYDEEDYHEEEYLSDIESECESGDE